MRYSAFSFCFILCAVAEEGPSPFKQVGIYHDFKQPIAGDMSRHVLARDAASVGQSLQDHRTYLANDALCGSERFHFIVWNSNGMYEIGDTAAVLDRNKLIADVPCRADMKLLRNGQPITQKLGFRLEYEIKEPGDYRLVATLPGDKAWIETEPIHLVPRRTAVPRPAPDYLKSVDVTRDLPYISGKPEDAAKHRLDIYSPKNASKAPVLFFVHGGYWRSGDRAQYSDLGGRFASAGMVVVVPSYRLMPADKPPAQIEDVAAAFAWTVRNAEQYGGDAARIYIAGHSAGGHLVALLATNSQYLDARGIPVSAIKGVIPISGVFDVRAVPEIFGKDEAFAKDQSPIDNVKGDLPPFLLTYCQWDYPVLAPQAEDFASALRKLGNRVDVVYVPGQSHVSEIVNIKYEDDPTAAAVVRFVSTQGVRLEK